MQPLDDITIVDLSLKLPGPYATKLLADAGAEVLSIEPPGGDYLGDPESEEYRQTYAALNEGKQSILVNLKDERGQAFVQAVAAEADVVIEGFSPGTAKKLGVDPETLRAANEDLIYCSLSGYGQTGPRRNEPGHDLNYQGVAGFLDPDDPTPPKTAVADYAGATMLALSVLIALWGRNRGGGGQYIDLAMFDVIASWNSVHLPWVLSDDEPTDYDPVIGGEYPCYNTYETGDGRYLTLGAMERGFWVELCDSLDLPELLDEQFATSGRESDAYKRLQEVFKTRSLDEWVEKFGQELPVSAVQTTTEALNDPQVAAREHLVAVDEQTGEIVNSFGLPVTFSPLTGGEEGRALDETLDRAGYGADTLAELEASGVITHRDEP
ncbi:CaiB/BaiF CoA transferase family protein [Haladaptatus sp. ZSTT2]|uniref:CaiB/BaiF CoA transferase family protein n=1 Tax=Haladaptatus sp. ZSTT2 TaxID=3120515 RepID=UPI00300F0188